MKVDKKSIGELVDALITANIRCWFAQNEIMNKDNDIITVANNAKLAQQCNIKRNSLIRAIDGRLELEYSSPDEKNYG